MKIVINTNELAPIGGLELSVLQTARELATRGHEVNVLAQKGGELEAEMRSFCKTVTIQGDFFQWEERLNNKIIHPVQLIRRAAPVIWATAAARALHPDLVYVNQVTALPWGHAASALSGRPLVCHLHISLPISRLQALCVSEFVAVSSSLRSEYIARGLDPDLIQVIPNGVDLADYPVASPSTREQARLELGLNSGKFVALFYGRLIPDKGVHVLLEAWRRSSRLQDEGTLLIMGASPLTGLYEQELRSFAPRSCVFLPMRRDVITPLHAADVVVLPSLWKEPFGRVVIEAMATGCPVVATRVGGIPEILTERFDSLLVDSNDPNALANKIETLIGWRERVPELSAACRAHVRDHFGLEAMVDALEDLFCRALQHRRFHL